MADMTAILGAVAARAAGPVAASSATDRATERINDGFKAFWDGRLPDAAVLFRIAVELDPEYELAADYGHGLIAWWRNDFDAAAQLMRPYVRARPWAAGLVWLGHALSCAGRLLEADREFRLALEIDPSNPEAQRNVAWSLLRRGELAAGWAIHEMRVHARAWHPYDWSRACRLGLLARWDGSPLDGRRLLVMSEHGLGDMLMDARFIPLLAGRGGPVTVWAPPPLARLWAQSFASATIEVTSNPNSPADTWCAAGSLPHLLGTTSETLPPPPYVRPAPAEVERWRQRLGIRPDALNVGLCWKGRPSPALPSTNDIDKSGLRDVELVQLSPLASIPGVRWFSLQVGQFADDPAPPGMRLERIARELQDFNDTAAAVSALDVTVSVDTAVANLVGATGCPGLIFLPKPAEYRWGEHEVSAWYPQLKLLRQRRQFDWADPIARVADELAKLAAARGDCR